MPSKTFVYIILAIVIAHFLLAVGYLIYKIMKAPKSTDEETEQEVKK